MPPKPWEKYSGATADPSPKPWDKYQTPAPSTEPADSDPYVPVDQEVPTSEMKARPGGVAEWFNDLKSDLEYGGDRTAPGRALGALGAKGLLRGTSEGAANIMGGTFLGPARAGHGITKIVDPASTMHERARGVSEAIQGGTQTLALPAAIAAPAILPEIVPSLATYGLVNQGTSQGLQKVGVDPDYAQAAADLITIAAPKIKQGVGATGRFAQRNSETLGKVAAVVPAIAKAVTTKNPDWLLGGLPAVSKVMGKGIDLGGRGMEAVGNAKIFPHEVMDPLPIPEYSEQVLPPTTPKRIGGTAPDGHPRLPAPTSIQQPESSLPSTQALPGKLVDPKQLGPATSIQVPGSSLRSGNPIRLKASSLPEDPMSPEAGDRRLGDFLNKSGLFRMKPEGEIPSKLVDTSSIESSETQPLTKGTESDNIRDMTGSKPVPERGYSDEEAARDTATIAQAKRELGEDAPVRQIIARAQEIKQQISPDILESLGIKSPSEQGSMEQQAGLNTTHDQQLQATLNSKNQASIFKAFVEAMNKKEAEGPLPLPPKGAEPNALISVPESMTNSGVSRRDFLKSGVRAAGGAMVSDKIGPLLSASDSDWSGVSSVMGWNPETVQGIRNSFPGITPSIAKKISAIGNILSGEGDILQFNLGEGQGEMLSPKTLVEELIGGIFDNSEDLLGDPVGTKELIDRFVNASPILKTLLPEVGSQLTPEILLQDAVNTAQKITAEDAYHSHISDKSSQEPENKPLVEAPKPFQRTPEDAMDDKVVQQEMRQDLDKHGEEAETVKKMLFFAKNKPDFGRMTQERYGENVNIPGEESNQGQKPKKLVDDSMLGPGAAAKNGPEFDDLVHDTSNGPESVPKVREIRANPSLDESIALQKALGAGQKEPVNFKVPNKSDLGKKLVNDEDLRRDEIWAREQDSPSNKEPLKFPNPDLDKPLLKNGSFNGLKVTELTLRDGKRQLVHFSPEAQELLTKIGLLKKGQRSTTITSGQLEEFIDDLDNESAFGEHSKDEQTLLNKMIDQAEQSQLSDDDQIN